MQESLRAKLEQLLERFDELAALLSDSDVISNQSQFTALSKEYAEIEPVVKCYQELTKKTEEMNDARSLLDDADEELRDLAELEANELEEQVTHLDSTLQMLLIPKDPNDSHNVFLEIRAGTGGDEAALFANELLRMYQRYAEDQNWKVDYLSVSDSEKGGMKEVIAKISGQVAEFGVLAFISMMAYISISLGLVNLFPIPMLDGGHLMFYAFEKLLGRPLSQKTQEGFFRIGMFLLLSLMFFTTFNDLKDLGLFR